MSPSPDERMNMGQMAQELRKIADGPSPEEVMEKLRAEQEQIEKGVLGAATPISQPRDWQCFEKAIMRGQQTFTLVAQDITAARTIMFWLMENIETAPDEKLRDAFEDALRMRHYGNRKYPD
jgi:hypothetical protein